MPYLELLRPFGDLTLIGPLLEPLKLNSMVLLGKSASISGSLIGSPSQIERMLKLAVEKGINSWYQKYNFEDINTAFEDFDAGKPRFRFVLVNEENGGKL
jgi:alcohol dehydrogenase (NADP+)